jgi:hypothetical protein
MILLHGEARGNSSPRVRLLNGDVSKMPPPKPLISDSMGRRDVRGTSFDVRSATLCVGSRVSAALLFPKPNFAGAALAIWRPSSMHTGVPRSLGMAIAHEHDVCMMVPPNVQSVRVISDDAAIMTNSQGQLFVVRNSLPYMLGTRRLEPGVYGPTTTFDPRERLSVATVCLGRALRAIELFDAVRWGGNQKGHSTSSGCKHISDAHDVASIRLRQRADTVELSGPLVDNRDPRSSKSAASVISLQEHWRSLVAEADLSHIRDADFALSRVALGSNIRGVVLYRGEGFTGPAWLLRGSMDVRNRAHADDVVIDLPQKWKGAVRSLVILRACTTSNMLCDGSSADTKKEFSLELHGEILPYRSPVEPPFGVPAHLAAGRRGTFHTYNPSLLVEADGTVSLIARWSNYNFCNRKRNFEENVAEAKGALMSFVVRGTLNTTTWQLRAQKNLERGNLAAWKVVDDIYPVVESQVLSGAEDPRVLRLGKHVLLWLAVWESAVDDGVQWQHLLKVRDSDASGAMHRRMELDARYAGVLSRWIPQLGRPRRTREKNWVPFVWRGGLYVEYSLEPRLVLSVNPDTGESTPLLPLTSSPALSVWVERLGPVSGGTPAVELVAHGVFLALAHVKLFKKKGTRTATSSMSYKHFWYAFEAQPPFAVLGASLPFTLPSQLKDAPSIQFATGLLYRPRAHELIVSYGELDCYATIARFPLTATLEATLGRRKADQPPVPLLMAVNLSAASKQQVG